KLLLDNGQDDGAYYLVGYAVECALKAVIAGRTRQYEFPDLAFVRKVYTHNLKDLLDLSGLKAVFDQEFAKDPDLRNNWDIAQDWQETSRYEAGRLRQDAESLYTAVADAKHGILLC